MVVQDTRPHFPYTAGRVHEYRSIEIVDRCSDRARLVTTARLVIIECSVGHLDLWSRLSRSDAPGRYRQVVNETFEAAVIDPVQLRGTHVDIILVECLDVETVCARTLQPKPITGCRKVLVRIHLGINRIRA